MGTQLFFRLVLPTRRTSYIQTKRILTSQNNVARDLPQNIGLPQLLCMNLLCICYCSGSALVYRAQPCIPFSCLRRRAAGGEIVDASIVPAI